jgi:hypothetical protein
VEGKVRKAIRNLIRWSAAILLLSALTGIISILFTPSDFAPNAILGSLWTPMHAVLAVSYMLFVFGLIGIYAIQADKAGRLGSIGFGLAFFGMLVLTVQVFVAAFILPVIASQPNAPKTAFDLLDPAGPLAAFSSLVFADYVPTVIGLVLLGVAIMRAGVLPRWAGLLLIIGTLLDLALLMGAPGELIVKLGDALFDVGKLWIVYGLWTYNSDPKQRPVGIGNK